MKGSVFARTLPSRATAARDQMIFDAVRRRDIPPIEWSPITTRYTNRAGHSYTATLKVSKDGLRVGDATDSFRVTVNHRTAQQIADSLGVSLISALISDQIWTQAPVRLPTSKLTQTWFEDGTMSHTSRMLQQSAHVDRLIAGEHMKGKRGLVADVGKDWVNTMRLWQPYTPCPTCEQDPVRSANYGWHEDKKVTSRAASLPGKYVWQSVGLRHGIKHVDYSQVVRLVRRDVEVCGPGMGSTGCGIIDIRSIVTDPAIAGLVSHTGALPSMRHPGVPPSCEPGVRCPDDVTKPMPGMSGDLVKVGGGISCPVACDKLPPVEPDPTPGAPGDVPVIHAAGLGAGEKVAIFAAGGLVGYFAAKWLAA